jgi:hypothetical protein
VCSGTFAAVDGLPTCSRVDCCELAVALFAFDASECLVWLDPISTPGRGAGVLCERHADRLSPPRGWNLLDRRASESRLWTGRVATTSARATPHTPRRERTARARACPPSGPRLPFDTIDDERPTATVPDPVPTAWSPHGRPDPELEHVLDARTPLLARAFEAARSVDSDPS